MEQFWLLLMQIVVQASSNFNRRPTSIYSASFLFYYKREEDGSFMFVVGSCFRVWFGEVRMNMLL